MTDAQPGPGHNGIDGVLLGSFMERIERLEEEKRSNSADIKEVYAEAKDTGFDTKIMRMLIKERRMDRDELDEQETMLDIYKRALGMLVDTPLGQAALRRPANRAEGPKAAGKPAKANIEAHQAGREDGLAGVRDHAARWPAGVYGCADYEIGHDVGQRERHGYGAP